MKKKTISFVTGSRAEFGLIHSLLKEIQSEKKFKLDLAVTGMHLMREFGLTFKEISKSKIKISKKIKTISSIKKKDYIINCLSIGVKKFGDYFRKKKPSLICLPADRHEMLAPAIAAFHQNIPIAHFFGGELSNGSKDDTIRHCLTKLSNLHFVTHPEHKKRVIQLGENPKNVFLVGNMAIDNILSTKFLKKRILEKKINHKFLKKSILVTYHPISNSLSKTKNELKNLLFALNKLNNIDILFTKPNNDHGSEIVLKMIKNFIKKNKRRAKLYNSFGHEIYYSTVRKVDCVIGNSSSGLTEVPFLGTTSVNIGVRQSGRVSLENIININSNKDVIFTTITKALCGKLKNKDIKNNIYFKNGATKRILKIIGKVIKSEIIKKPFYDLR